MYLKTLSFLAAILFVAITAAEARDQIHIVGSSTVFPFSTTVAEQFGKTSKFKTPIVESTGSGGGMKLFCAGVGQSHPDITNALKWDMRITIRLISRAVKPFNKPVKNAGANELVV